MKKTNGETERKISVSIVIPNWNGVDLLKKYLPRVIAASDGAEIIVADDFSSDLSVPYVQKNFPKVIIVENRKHEGFAGNVNRGVARASGDVIVLLNTDVVPEDGFLPPLLAYFADPLVFAVGCLEKSHEKGKIVLRGRGTACWKKGFYVHARGEVDKTDTAWVSGGSGAFRKTMWDELGGMDSIYNPFYWEDIDLSYRARKRGYTIVFESKSIVHHYHEEGKIRREYSPEDVKRIAYRNQFIFIWKNATDPAILCAHIIWMPIRIAQTFFSGDNCMFHGYLLALQKIPYILRRRNIQGGTYAIRDENVVTPD
jgi:O-antigen biosynthesis protein